jgi:hypothetical protein
MSIVKISAQITCLKSISQNKSHSQVQVSRPRYAGKGEKILATNRSRGGAVSYNMVRQGHFQQVGEGILELRRNLL